MFKRNCVVTFSDSSGIAHSVKVEAESLFEAAIRGLQRLDMDSSFWTGEEVFDGMFVRVEIYEESTTHTVSEWKAHAECRSMRGLHFALKIRRTRLLRKGWAAKPGRIDGHINSAALDTHHSASSRSSPCSRIIVSTAACTSDFACW